MLALCQARSEWKECRRVCQARSGWKECRRGTEGEERIFARRNIFETVLDACAVDHLPLLYPHGLEGLRSGVQERCHLRCVGLTEQPRLFELKEPSRDMQVGTG